MLSSFSVSGLDLPSVHSINSGKLSDKNPSSISFPHFGQIIPTSPISFFVSYPHPLSTLQILQFILFLLLPPRQGFVIDQLCRLPLRTESPRLSLISSLEDFPFYSAYLLHILVIVATIETILATLQTISSKFFALSDPSSNYVHYSIL